MRDILQILEQVSEAWELGGFTRAIKWETKKYIIELTHNTFIYDASLARISETLETQASELKYEFDILTVWGWVDSKTWALYIDIGTSVDDLEHAKNIGKYYWQLAIWDSEAGEEIILKYNK